MCVLDLSHDRAHVYASFTLSHLSFEVLRCFAFILRKCKSLLREGRPPPARNQDDQRHNDGILIQETGGIIIQETARRPKRGALQVSLAVLFSRHGTIARKPLLGLYDEFKAAAWIWA